MNSATFLRDTVDLVKSIETRFLELGARLYRVRYEELWKDSYDSYEEFLDTARVNPSMASILVKVHQHYIVNGRMTNEKLSGIGYSNLYEAIPLLEDESVESVVMKARTLTRSEIKQEVREEKHPDCAHVEVIIICAKCKKRVHDAEYLVEKKPA